MTPEEDRDLVAGALQLLMAGSNGLWWIGHPDGDIDFEPESNESIG